MEMEALNNEIILQEPIITSTAKRFIEANTTPCSLDEIRDRHIIRVFIKDNEPVISHRDFIDITLEVATEAFPAETILRPNITLSHPVKEESQKQSTSQLRTS